MNLHTLKPALLLSLTLLLSACSLLPASKPVQSWTLTPPELSNTGPVQLTDLRILRPQVQDLLSNSYILVVPEDQPISVYQGARWSASIPTLWRDYLVSALQSDGRFARISSDEVRVAARYELIGRLDSFQSEYQDGQAIAVLRGYLQLVDADSREILAERPLAHSTPADSPEIADVVAAFSELMAESTREIETWLLNVQRTDPVNP